MGLGYYCVRTSSLGSFLLDASRTSTSNVEWHHKAKGKGKIEASFFFLIVNVSLCLSLTKNSVSISS